MIALTLHFNKKEKKKEEKESYGLQEVMELFYILVAIAWLYAYVKTHQKPYLLLVNFVVYCTSINMNFE